MGESQNIEYKESWRDEYLKWICGFANSAYVKVVVIGMVLLGIMVFYIGNFMYLLIKGQMVYDGILGTRFESLIGDKESEKNT